jgi:Uncharacterized protein conserved in bacteria (DUF2252)
MFAFLLMGFSFGISAKSNDGILPILVRLYPDQTLETIKQRVALADSPQEKWRSFPPYYFDLVSRLRIALGPEFSARQGFCAGDAHIDNFGFLFSQQSIFTLNDLDDSAPCALNADLMRLFISHRLLKNFDEKAWLGEYQKGLDKEEIKRPNYLEHLEKKSTTGARGLPAKFAKLLNQRSCQGEYGDLTSLEFLNLKNILSAEGKELTFGCSRTKLTGGSAGARRFIALTTSEAIEYKPLLNPAPLSLQISQNQRIQYFNTSVMNFLGEGFAPFYRSILIDGKLYQRRPLWAGNVGVDFTDISDKDLEEVFFHEAKVLGRLHRLSNSARLNIDPSTWIKISDLLMNQFQKEF